MYFLFFFPSNSEYISMYLTVPEKSEASNERIRKGNKKENSFPISISSKKRGRNKSVDEPCIIYSVHFAEKSVFSKRVCFISPIFADFPILRLPSYRK